MTFDNSTVEKLHAVSKVSLVEGVDISNEELEALKEAANAKASAMDYAAQPAPPKEPESFKVDPAPVQKPPASKMEALEAQMANTHLNQPQSNLAGPSNYPKSPDIPLAEDP